MSLSTATVASETYTPFIESDAAASVAELCATMDEQGYLFFRGLVPDAEVLAVRRDVLELCAEAGWVDTSHDLMEGITKPGVVPTRVGQPEYMAVYRKMLKLPCFHDFPMQPSLLAVAARILDIEMQQVLAHPRRIGRVTFPNYEVVTTPPHQDHFYIRGAVATYSCWIPLGACPMSLGGLAVWPGSQRQGLLDHSVPSEGAGGRGVPVEEDEAVWHTSDFGIGDALFFHSYTIHKALPNCSGNRLRLSTDNRYQRPKEEIDPASLLPHAG